MGSPSAPEIPKRWRDLSKDDLSVHLAKLPERDLPIRLEIFKWCNEAGRGAIQASFLLNGGAAVALLAFLAQFQPSGDRRVPALDLSAGLKLFVLGVGLSAAATFATYGTALALRSSRTWLPKTFNWIAVLCIALATGCFVYGCLSAFAALERVK